jgi:hypothetical protein
VTVLLNILIALYNTSYDEISGNADDEYMALFSQRTLQYVRAPDENVFIPRTKFSSFIIRVSYTDLQTIAFNLIEILFLVLPFEWWMPYKTYGRLNNFVMGVIYSPLLLITSYIETREARRIWWNRRRGEADDTIHQEWEELAAEVDFDVTGDEWSQIVQETKPNIELPAAVLEIRELKKQVESLSDMVRLLTEEQQRSAQSATTNGTLSNGNQT